MRFLTDQNGPRARWRRELCHLTGLDPAALDALVAREREHWPPLDEYSTPDRKASYSSRHRTSESRTDSERRREASRQCMQRKRAREKQDSITTTRTTIESYSRRGLSTGTSLTFLTFRD